MADFSKTRSSVSIQNEEKTLGSVSVAVARPARSWATAILAHGAGGSMDTPSVVEAQESLAENGVVALRFNFLYRELGKKTPDRRGTLEATWKGVADWARKEFSPKKLFLGGRSMGGRIASHLVASGYPCQGLFFLAYPLHPPGKPDQLRKDHLSDIKVPMLFLSGTRDSFARPDLMEKTVKPLDAKLHWIDAADHGYRVTKSSGRSSADVASEVLNELLSFMKDT